MSRKSKNIAAIALASLAVPGLFAKSARAYVTFGDFEIPSGSTTNSNDGFFDWTAFGAAGYPANPGASPQTYFPPPYYTYSTEGATVGSQSLSVNYPIPGQSSGYYQGFAWGSEEQPDSEGNNAKLDVANSKMIAMDVTYNTAEWSANTTYDNLSLIINFNNGLSGSAGASGFLTLHQTNDGGQGLPTYDTGNTGYPGGWDPTDYPGTSTRTEFWDYGDYVPASYTSNGGTVTNSSNLDLSQLIGSNPSFVQFIWLSSSNGTGTYHLDNFRTTETGPENATWTNSAGPNAQGTYSWGSLNNWVATGGTAASSGNVALPSNAGDVVNFTDLNIGAPTTVSLNGNEEFQINVGTMNFNTGNGYTIAQGTGGTLTLNGTSTVFNYSQTFAATTRTVTAASAQINNLFGNNTISAPVQLATSAIIAVGQATNTFTISGNIGGTGGLTVGPTASTQSLGTTVLSGVNTYTGGTTVAGGSLVIAANGALANGAVSVTGGSLKLGASTGAATVKSLSVSGNGTFDLTNNHLFINYGSGTDPIASIAALLATGYNAGAWNGVGGIITSAPLVNGGLTYGLGYADGADPQHVATGLASGTIEIKYTLLGDADLNGIVNGIDFGILAANFNKGITGWDEGDFDYNNIVNGLDFGDLAANFNKGAAGTDAVAALDAFAAANGLLADVPEPASIGLLAMGACGLMARRRNLKKNQA